MNWTEVAGLATAASAAATTAAALFTAWMAKETKTLAQRTEAEADATVQSARATVELAEQGLIAYQPVLAVEVFETRTTRSNESRSLDVQLKLVNVGMGPAVGCVVAIHDHNTWCISPRLSISAAEERTLGAAHQGVDVPSHWFSRGGTPFPTVIFCRDVTDRRYRFLVDKNGQVLAPEVRSPTASPGGWWSDPDLWPPALRELADS